MREEDRNELACVPVQEEPEKVTSGPVRIRRVGSVTFGLMLICYGVMFLVHIFVPNMTYSVIFRCWPLVFILLGVEILAENRGCKTDRDKIVYDFPAVLMLGIMLLFAMCMAVMDYAMEGGTIMW